MMQKVDSSTPIAMLTVGQLVEVLSEKLPSKVVETVTDEKRYVYGMKGIAQILGVVSRLQTESKQVER